MIVLQKMQYKNFMTTKQLQQKENKMRDQKDISKYGELIDYNSKQVNNYLKNHYKGWSYCGGCEDWFLDEEDCNCDQ